MVLTLSTEQDVSRNTPIDYIAIEGHHDTNCKRVDLQTKTVIDYVPPQPSSDHQWNNDTKRWALRTKGHARSTALMQISVLETKGIRAMREAQLGKLGAQDRLAALEAQIEGLRAVLWSGEVWSHADFGMRVLIISHRYKLRMPQLFGARPLSKFDSDNHFRLYPNAPFHFLRGQSLAQRAFGFFGQIGKGTLCGFKAFDLVEDFAPSGRLKSERPSDIPFIGFSLLRGLMAYLEASMEWRQQSAVR
jgi:hypothetical protein